MPTSVFADYDADIYTRYAGELELTRIVGGIPSNPRVIEGWISSKLGADNAELIAERVAQTMIERGIGQDDAVEEVKAETKLNGFKKNSRGLYLEGRCLKSAIREAANVSWPKRSWGPSRKGTRSYWAEHVYVVEDELYLGVEKPTGIQQRFVSVWRGTGIQYEEYVDNARVSFTVKTDADDIISKDDWAELWTRAENLGLGSTRSQGFGKFVVTKWERL